MLCLLFSFMLMGTIYASAATFSARGNEPFWHVEVRDTGIVFRALDGESVTVSPVPEVRIANGVRSYQALADDRPFRLNVTDQVCTDTMSGMPYPNTVAIQWGNQHFSGCGGKPVDLLLGTWEVERIKGAAVIEQSRPSIQFYKDGRVSGNATCNRFNGKYALTGEGLTISGMALTRRLCAQPLMDQERALVGAVEKTSHFGMDTDERLLLFEGSNRLLVAKRPR